MGGHMLPGREQRRATRRSMRFTFAVIMAVPLLALIAVWVFAGATIVQALAHGGQSLQHGTDLVRIVTAAVIGLVAVLITALLMAWFARRIARDVASLGATARLFADEQLPELVARLRRGDELDLATDLPPPASANVTEISRIAAVLAGVQQTTVAATASEIRLRNGISQVFMSLARRNQSLLQRQLRLIDDLERKAADPGALADLFPLDHLTTRMRRHAEGLIILSGASPGRAWSSPVPVIDVIRGAIAEVEDYKRVAVVTASSDMVTGSAAADMIHLLAELIENACLFSPSGMRVEVRAERVGNGFAFEIEDRGLGIKSADLDAINERLGSPADFDLANADQLGLFVVGKLAARHGVRVFLRPSPYRGTTSIVMMPHSLITYEADAPRTAADAEPTRQGQDMQLALTGRLRRPSPAEPPGPGPGATSAAPGDSGPGDSGPGDSGPGDSGPGDSAAARTPAAASAGAWPTAIAEPGQTGAETPERREAALPRRPSPAVAAGTHNGLPRRVRQANMSPHLRNGALPGEPAMMTPTAGHEPADRSPEQARSLLSSLQSGWERGRQDRDAPGTGPAGSPGNADPGEHQPSHEEG
jgi:signal transduction histidine kinase